MPTDPTSSVVTTRPPAGRDEALRRYTQHLAAVQIRNSRWRAVLSRSHLAARASLLSAPAVLRSVPHAH